MTDSSNTQNFSADPSLAERSSPSPSVENPSVDRAIHPTFPANWNYETTVIEVETIINRIEMGELDLAEVFDQFATAVKQLRQCETFLTRQQQQVDLLIETLLDESDSL